MKKLVLKKDIVARINGGEMHNLRGGGLGYTIDDPQTCGHTCNMDGSCPGVSSCVESCYGTCDQFCRTWNHLCMATASQVGCYTGGGGGERPGTAADCVTTKTMAECM